MNQLKAVTFGLTGGNQKVFGAMLLSATFVLVARLLAPLRIQWDLSIQLEAAYRLVQGLGLTNAFSSQFDISQPPISEFLTHFPPGFSLIVAAFIGTGIPLAIALKLIYGVTTLVGWVAWAIIGSRCLVDSIKVGQIALPLNLVVAAALPLFFTPSWTIQGTDTFLWAGLPIVVLLLGHSANGLHRSPKVPNRTAESGTYGRIVLAGVSGIFIGLLILIRYPSAFLFLGALLIISYVDFPRLQTLVKRVIVLGTSCCMLTVPTLLYLNWSSQLNQPTVASSNDLFQTHRQLTYRAVDSDVTLFTSIAKAAQDIFSSFSNTYILTGIDSSKLESLFDFSPVLGDVLGLAFLLGIVALCGGLILQIKRQGRFTGDDTSVALLCMIIAFVVFAIALAPVVLYSPLDIDRYYDPVIFCLVLVAYRIATLFKINRLVRRSAIALVVAFTLYNVGVKPLDWLFLDSQRDLMFSVLAAETKLADIPYPSNQVLSFHEDSRNFLAQIERQEPDAIFFIQDYPLYLSYLSFDNPLRVRRISDSDFWKSAYLSQPTKVFWVTNHEDCTLICASEGNFNSNSPERTIEPLMSLPNLETVFTSAEDDAMIMVSTLPGGYRFMPPGDGTSSE